MTILNLFIGTERALLGVDTLAVVPDKSGGSVTASCSKLSVIAHLGVVIACRGPFVVASKLFHAISASENPTFEHMVENVPETIGRLLPLIAAGCPAGMKQEDIYTFEFVAVGFSERRDRPLGYAWRMDGIGSELEFEEITAPYISPWSEELARRRPVDEYEMRVLALRQIQLMRNKTPNLVTGGRLIVAEITPCRIIVRPGCDLFAPEIRLA